MKSFLIFIVLWIAVCFLSMCYRTPSIGSVLMEAHLYNAKFVSVSQKGPEFVLTLEENDQYKAGLEWTETRGFGSVTIKFIEKSKWKKLQEEEEEEEASSK